MKFPVIALTIALVSSSIATSTPTTVDAPRSSPSFSIHEVMPVEEGLLEATAGGLDRAACIGVSIGLGLGGLIAGAVSGGVGWAIAGAYAPAVGAALCSL